MEQTPKVKEFPFGSGVDLRNEAEDQAFLWEQIQAGDILIKNPILLNHIIKQARMAADKLLHLSPNGSPEEVQLAVLKSNIAIACYEYLYNLAFNNAEAIEKYQTLYQRSN